MVGRKKDVPNRETMEAFREADKIRRNPAASKGYDSAEEMLENLKK